MNGFQTSRSCRSYDDFTMLRRSCLPVSSRRRYSFSKGLKGKLFGGVKVKRARSFSGRDKQKWSPTKEPRDDTATTVSDSEAKSHGRRPRRRTTGGSEVNEDVEKARQGQGYSSEQDGHSTQTLSRQQIISMVKKRFGLKPEQGGGSIQNGPEEQAPAVPPPPASPSSPKQQRYEALLDKPGTYPTLPRKEENHVPHTNSTPGVVYLQFGDEIKRAMLPSGLGDLKQVRHMFEQTFPDKIKNNGNNRKTIYIKDNSCGVFYELDNVNDLSNKSHLKVLESRPMQNGPMSQSVSTSSAVHMGAQATSTPLPNHSYVMPSNAINSGVKYTRTTTVTRQGNDGHNVTTVTRVVGDGANENKVVRTAVTEGTFMDQRKVALPGLGATLKPTGKRRTSRDPVEDQLDNLTSMLEDALKTGSQDSLHKSTEGSASSSQSSFIDHGPSEGNDPSHAQTFRSRVRSDSGNESQSSDVSPTPPLEGKPKNIPAPPPRASSHTVSRESSLKYSQTLQRDYSPRGVKRDLNLHYQTLPLPASKQKQRTMTDSPVVSSLSSSPGSPTSVKYEGRVKDKKALEVKASTLRGDLKMLRVELNQLKQFQTFQARQYEDMIRNVKDQLLRSISRISQMEDTSLRSERRKVQMEEMSYVRSKNDLNRHISELESEVEMVRLDVVQKRSIANPVEVQSLNSQLAIISRQVSDLKSQFAELHDNMKSIMASELDVIVQGDKFLKEEPSKLENLVSRCKHVTGTLFTLQKLVSAQEQMKSESQASFSSLEEVDKEVLDSIRSVHREYLQQRGFDPYSEESKNGSRSRQRVRFYDEVTQMP